MGFFGNLDPEQYDRQYSDRRLLRRLADYFVPHQRDIRIIILGVSIAGALDVIFPLSIANVLNSLAKSPNLPSLLALVGDEFNVALTDPSGRYRAWPVNRVKFTIDAPAQVHVDLLGKYRLLDDDGAAGSTQPLDCRCLRRFR